MVIDDAIQTLTKIYQSIDKDIPNTAANPDELVTYLNDLYGESYEGLTTEELFSYDDVKSPSITLTIGVDVEFDLKRVMENMRKKLHVKHYGTIDSQCPILKVIC